MVNKSVQARYLFCFNTIVKELEDKETNLKEAQDGINERVEQERQIHSAIDIEKDVEKWLADVVKEMADVQTLKAKIAEKKSCLNGWCPNWGCQYWMGRKASKETSKLSNLHDRGKFNTAARPKPLPSDKEMPIPRFVSSFETTESACNQIIEALKKDNIKMVGLHGVGGVGKTTLAKVVGNRLRQEKIFDEVGIATVSQDPNIKNVQSELVESLGRALDEVDEKKRADRLRLMFSESKGRKILIILDDVWKELDLETVGIPANCCKILLTTRLQQVCDRMGCDTRIKLDALDQAEGLNLLREHAGIDVADKALTDVSKRVADECKGLPLAIKAVGSALRGNTADQWNLALEKLQNAKLDKIEGIDKDSQDVYGCLKFSYDYLNGEDSRSCFLLCSLFPQDYKIDLEDLLGYAVGLVWYQAESIEKARSLLRGTIKGLKDSSLLLDTDDDRFVKMHDVVRDVALWIGSEEKKFFTSKVVIGLAERAVEEGLKQYRGISLVGNGREELPSGLECRSLHILRLENTEYDNKLQVPEHFFKEMPALKVVTIIGGVLSLKSLQFLTNLQVLQLIRCEVTDASFLGKLEGLQILYLKMSRIEIPDGLGVKLRILKLLYIDTCSISPITINEFVQLEEFYGLIKNWAVQGMSSEESSARHAELNPRPDGSVKLRILEVSECFHLRDTIDALLKHGFENLETLYIGDLGVQVVFQAEAIIAEGQENKLFPCLKRLYLTNLRELQVLYHEGPTHNFSLQNLTYLTVSSSPKLRRLFSSTLARNLLQLEKLEIYNCWELEQIIAEDEDEEHLQPVCFPNFREISIRYCPKLKHLFHISVAPSLQKLKNLYIGFNDELKEVFWHKDGADVTDTDYNEIVMNELWVLELRDLPNLTNFWPAGYQIPFPSVSSEDVHYCTDFRVVHNCPRLPENSEVDPFFADSLFPEF
ncbi:probable disease resistance protein At1g61300 [Citrus sinensis]|uniref:probable disease resistance protein At1g61300 n=1 Tax=Citrus sinensis TaxID=2711 RepID=UPI0022786ADC|nr:probable disease resistance protein At1g61300 [Citrus sinensis]